MENNSIYKGDIMENFPLILTVRRENIKEVDTLAFLRIRYADQYMLGVFDL